MGDLFMFVGLIALTFVFVFVLGWFLDKMGWIE